MYVSDVTTYLYTHHVHYGEIPLPDSQSPLTRLENVSIPSNQLAKSVMLNTADEMIMVVIPASSQLLLEGLEDELNIGPLTLAKEHHIATRFPDCELGQMPPIPELYGMDVYISDELMQSDHIYFSSGHHDCLLKVLLHDYEDLVQPFVHLANNSTASLSLAIKSTSADLRDI